MVFPSGRPPLFHSSLWRRLLVMLMPTTGSYRPERYYMRGPGPKYRERHGGGLLNPIASRRGMPSPD